MTKIIATPVVALQVLQQLEILRLDRDVEIGGRLVGDDQLRARRQRDGADDALAHAAAHLVRIFAQPLPGDGMRTRAQQFLHPLAAACRPRSGLMVVGRLGDLLADREQRVQRRHRVLQDHGDRAAADRAHLRGSSSVRSSPSNSNATADDPRAGRQQPDDRKAGRGLAAARTRRSDPNVSPSSTVETTPSTAFTTRLPPNEVKCVCNSRLEDA